MIDLSACRIAIASCGLGHVQRGIEAWALDTATALRRRGLPVRLYQGGGVVDHPLDCNIGCWPRESKSTQLTLQCVPRRLGWRWGWGSPYAIEQTTFAARLLRCLRRDRIDLLHVQDPLVARAVLRAARRGLSTTRVILGHGTEEPPEFLNEFPYVQHLAPWHLRQTLSAISDQEATSRATSTAWPRVWRAVGNFVDTARFSPGTCPNWRAELGIPTEALVVVCVAAVKRNHKRIDHLLAEFAQLRQTCPQLPVWLVVAGATEADTPELIREGQQRLGDRVRFCVDLPRDRITALLRAATLFVLPSLWEMMPIAVLEAVASGLPCLTHQHPVLEWMTGQGGRAIDMSLPGELARQLEQLLSDHESRLALGQRAREHAVHRFSESVIVDELLDYYAEVLGNPMQVQVA